MQFSQPHTKYFQNLNSNDHFLHVTFAALLTGTLTGTYQVLLVDYDRYIILNECRPDLNKCKYVFWCILNGWQREIY